MPAIFSHTRRVAFSETDMAGIVHFANFFRFIEDAEHEFFRSLGMTIMDRQADGSVVSWPRVNVSCSFDAPAQYDDLLTIQLANLDIGRRSLTLSWDIYRDEKRLCRGEMKTVCCAFRPGERLTSIDIPEPVRAKLETVMHGA